MSDNPARPPRFPYVGALLCAACLGAAVWTWMRYSYCWDWTPSQLPPRVPVQVRHPFGVAEAWPSRSYVRVRGFIDSDPSHVRPFGLPMVCLDDEQDPASILCNVPPTLETGRTDAVCGRLLGLAERPGNGPEVFVWFLRPEQSRFAGASIAGLVVGAMGVFVFAVALRHWLGERRKSRAEAKA